MKFSTLIAADLAPENQVLGNGKAANPANPANLIDLQRNPVANLLLISAKDLLIGEQDQPPPVEISSGLANFSNGLASERLGIINEKQ